MTTPAQDRDQRAALSADRPKRTEAELEAAARRLLVECGQEYDGYHHASGAGLHMAWAWYWAFSGAESADFPTALAAAVRALLALDSAGFSLPDGGP